MIKNIFQRNNLWFGIGLAIITPVIAYFLLQILVDYLSNMINYGIPLIRAITVQMLAIFLNLIFFIKYIRSAKYEQTGKGIMLVTFVMVIIHFIIRWQIM
jgi:hypothetical protein